MQDKNQTKSNAQPEVPILERFTDRAHEYVAHRPDYPAPAIDALLAGLPNPGTLTVADIGAGTGISARLVADRGPRVIAIEPNAAMRAAAAPHPRVSWLHATAEHTTLPESSVDLVLCAQSFHWMRRDEALDEFRRILRPPPRGRVALLWNIQDHDDPFTREYADILRRSAVRPVASPSLAGRPAGFANDVRWTGARTLEFPHAQSLDEPGLLGRAVSASYTPKDGPRHADMAAALRDAFNRAAQNCVVTLRYRTILDLAERA